MSNNYNFADIVNNDFITGYTAYDVCRNGGKVFNIRSINNEKYDINVSNDINNLIYYNEELVNNQKIPYIYGSAFFSSINFGELLYDKSEYTICALTRYNGSTDEFKKNILNIENKYNVISSIGHANKWGGIIDYQNSTDKMFKSTDNNCGNNWVASCVSYDGLGNTTTIVGCDYNNRKVYKDHKSLKNIYGKLYINIITNNNANINAKNNSDWAFSHLLIWNKPLDANKLDFIYKSFIEYVNNPAKNDIILYNKYPRNLAPNNCKIPIEKFYVSPLNISKQLWAGYYAGDYNKTLNVLPNLTNDRTKDLTSNMLINVIQSTTGNITALSGSKLNSAIIFPNNSINSNFTICSITKYNSSIPESNNMILQSLNNNDNNLFYHGHNDNTPGVIMYNNTEFSKGYKGITTNSWIVSCAKNDNSTIVNNNVLINGNSIGLIIDNSYIISPKSPQTLTINYNTNKDIQNKYSSDWSLSYLLIWDTHLTDDELNAVSAALNNYITTGEKIVFNNITSPTVTAPTVTTPIVTTPIVTTPTVTTPTVTTPTVTTPTVTTPIVTTPVVATPQVVNPAAAPVANNWINFLNLTPTQKQLLGL
jgi:hypothetical protein